MTGRTSEPAEAKSLYLESRHDDLDRYMDAVERAEELDEKTDDLIDEIVYELYGLADEEIGIVEEAVAKD